MWDALCLKGGTLVYVGDPKADLGGPLAGKGALWLTQEAV